MNEYVCARMRLFRLGLCFLTECCVQSHWPHHPHTRSPTHPHLHPPTHTYLLADELGKRGLLLPDIVDDFLIHPRLDLSCHEVLRVCVCVCA